MTIISQDKIELVMKWIKYEIYPWIEITISTYPYLKYVIIAFAVSILIYLKHKKKSRKKHVSHKQNPTEEAKGGYKNFKGDTWYPDGRTWNKSKGIWEHPDYSNKE